MPATALGPDLIHGPGPGSATARVGQDDVGAVELLNTGHEMGGAISTTLLNASVASAGTATVGESSQK